MKKFWPEIVGLLIGFAITAPILWQVTQHSHWSVSFMLIGLWFDYVLRNLRENLARRRMR